MKQLKDIKNKIEWEKYRDPSFNWDDRSFYENNNHLAEDFIREFYTKVNWNYLSYFQIDLSEDILNDFMYLWNWFYIFQTIKVSEKLLRVIVQKVEIPNNLWRVISQYQKLSEDFIRDHQEHILWHEVSRYQKLSESFIEEFSHKVDWYNISRYQTLSEDFIENNVFHRMRAQDIVQYQKLSDAFVLKHFKNYFNCDIYGIIKYQKLNEDTIKAFIKMFQYNYEWLTLVQKQNLSEAFLIKHRKKIGWENILLFQNISPETIKKYRKEIPNKYLEGTKYEIFGKR